MIKDILELIYTGKEVSSPWFQVGVMVLKDSWDLVTTSVAAPYGALIGLVLGILSCCLWSLTFNGQITWKVFIEKKRTIDGHPYKFSQECAKLVSKDQPDAKWNHWLMSDEVQLRNFQAMTFLNSQPEKKNKSSTKMVVVEATILEVVCKR